MRTRVLLGDEAVAQGAIDAGLSGAYSYPGTPSTEIVEYIQRSDPGRKGRIHCRWSTNEKTALEAALGMSYAGKRAMASMKHVGLNVAADPFINSAIVGANGGLVVVAADDPSMHSSQNEQDSRFYADFALVPCIEPSDQQEAYAAPAAAFDLSERYRVPVLIRLTTRLAHSRAVVALGETREPNNVSIPTDRTQYVILPANARGSYRRLVERQPDLAAASAESPLNRYTDGPDKSLGILACGIANNYVLEATGGAPPHPVLKVSQYPAPIELIRRLLDACDEVVVVEEGFPLLEERLRGFPRNNRAVRGRLDGTLPRTGELSPGLVARALGLPEPHGLPVSRLPAPRPPALCPGCPHADTYNALNEAMAAHPTGRVFSDIGCYTLGAFPPYEAIDTCVEMGASITMAKGAADAGLSPAVAVIGDSTFTHSGMTGLLDCVGERTPVTILLLDNLTVAMTGGQDSQATSRLESICSGLGVAPDHIRVIVPLPKEHEKNARVIVEELAHDGPSVVIARRECVQTARRHPKKEAA